MAKENLNIDSDVLNDSDKTYSSYTDIYNVTIFSDEYKEKLKKSQLDKANIDEDLMNKMFTEDTNINKRNYAIEEEVKALNLFSKTKTQDVLKSDTQKQYNFTLIIVVCFVIIGYLSYLVANKYYFHKRKDRKDENYNNYKISGK